MATSADEFCTLCEQNDITRKAEIWCYECQDYMCLDCSRPHGVSRLSKRHNTVSIDDYRQIPDYIRSIKHVCMDHDEQFVSFCPTHNKTCCTQCILLNHKNCKNISLIEEALKTVDQTSRLSKIQQSVRDVIESIQLVRKDRDNYKQTVFEQEVSIKDAISTTRRMLNDRLESIEKASLKKLSHIVDTEISNTDNSIDELIKIEDEVTTLSENIKRVKDNATNKQILLGVQEIETSVGSAKQSLSAFRKTDSKLITFDGRRVTKIFEDIKLLGSFSISTTSNHMDIIDSESIQAQQLTVTPKTYDTVSLQLHRTIKFQQIHGYNVISGCAVLPDNTILIAEYNAKKCFDRILLICENGTINTVNLHERGISIFDIEKASKDGNTIAISTRNSKLHILDLENLNVKTIPMKGNINGISYHDGTIYCCSEPHGIISVYIKDDLSNFNYLLPYRCGTYSYIAFHEDHLYYTKSETSIECCDIEGNVVWSFVDTKILRQPRGIAVDKDGNIFVVGGTSENVIVISPNGINCREVLNSDSGLNNPRAISYDRENNRLLICNDIKKAFIYNIV